MRRLAVRLMSIAAVAVLTTTACTATGGESAGDDADRTGPGVTDDTVKIGFVTLRNAAGASGFISADQGDPQAQVDALVQQINDNGGIAGRSVSPVIQEFDSSTDSVQTENALCTAFTQDEAVFAVVLLGQRESSARTCYRNADTVMVDISGIALADSVYQELAPHFWAPGNMTLDAYASALVPTLDAAGFFDDAKVGVLIEKDPNYQSVFDSTLQPALEAVGVTDITTGEIDQTNASNAGATVGAAAAAFKTAGVTAVLFLGRPDNPGYFTAIAGPQEYFPRLSIGTFEDAQFSSANPTLFPPQALKDALGIGFAPPKDGVSASLAFPRDGAEADCVSIYESADITFAGRPEARTALGYCDALSFLQAAAASLPDGSALNADTIAGAAADLGTEWQSASTLETRLRAGNYAPASSVAGLAYSNGQFEYTGEPQGLAP